MSTQQTEELQLATAEAPDLATLERIDAPAIWDGFRAELEKIKSTAETLTVTSVEQKQEIALARDTRLALKKIRVAVEHKRKELVEGLKKKSSAIDGDAREIRVTIERLESRLEEQEEFAIRAESERVAKLQSERSAKLRSLGADPAFYPKLGEMPEAGFAQMVESFEVAAKLKQEREAAEEAARIAAEKAAEEERARIATENEKLRKEAAEKEAALKAEREAAEKARKEAAEESRKEAQRIEAEAAKERQKQEMAMQEIQGIQQQGIIAVLGRPGVRKGGTLECLEETLKETEEWPIGESFGPLQKAAQSAKEAAIASIQQAIRAFNERKAQEAQQKKAQAEHEALMKKNAAEKKAREEAEEAVRKAQQDAMDKQAAEAKARQDAAKAPDREKLVAFAHSLRALEFPKMSTEAGSAAVAKLIENTGKLADWTEKKALEF